MSHEIANRSGIVHHDWLPDNPVDVTASADAVQTAEFETTAGAVEEDDADTVLLAASSAWPPCQGATAMDGGMDGGML